VFLAGVRWPTQFTSLSRPSLWINQSELTVSITQKFSDLLTVQLSDLLERVDAHCVQTLLRGRTDTFDSSQILLDTKASDLR